MKKVVVFQIGRREDYFVPSVLARQGRLECLVTDLWISPDTFLHRLKIFSKSTRFENSILHSLVCSSNFIFFVLEVFFLIFRLRDSHRILLRNMAFQLVSSFHVLRLSLLPKRPILYFYSYAACLPMRIAVKIGFKCYLNQIDGGLREQKRVSLIDRTTPVFDRHSFVGRLYWRIWAGELALAHYILVNSEWTRSMIPSFLVKSSARLSVVPLCSKFPIIDRPKVYPTKFGSERPMELLFLGQIVARKGALQVLESISLLTDLEIRWRFVGRGDPQLIRQLASFRHVSVYGQSSRSEVMAFFSRADIFLFPTLSDGFGLTQLEAQAFGLPIVCSRYCAQVVEDGVNGWVLDKISGFAIAERIREIYYSTAVLSFFSAASIRVAHLYSADTVSRSLMKALDE